MQIEQLEILDFLRLHPPCSELPEEALRRVAAATDVRYFKAGTQILAFGQAADFWHIVRSGAVEIFRRSGTLYNQLTEGGHFGEFGLLRNKRVRFPAKALEDTLLYLVPEAVFTELFETVEQFAEWVEVEDRSRLRQVVSRHEGASPLMTATVANLVGRPTVVLDAGASATEAARHMCEHGVSSLLLTRAATPADERPKVVGIVTDRDLRSRLLASGRPGSTPVSEIMSGNLISVQHNQLVFEAMLSMLRHHVQHLPVMRGGQPVGVITQSDIIHYESRNSLFVVGNILRQTSVDDLAAMLPDVRACFTRMVAEDANSRMIGSAMSVIGRSFKQRLLELAEAELGPPPVGYCLLALGSMARQEQTIVTDQDNALILADDFDPRLHDAYFERLARFVCDGLARCGYEYCKGGVMATNRQWRRPLRQWEACFSEWIERPTPQSLLDSNIFFDLDSVAGTGEWAATLREHVAGKAKGNAQFLACMARNALLRTAPLGFFKEFVVESDGQHTKGINIKRRGTAPLADLIRVHALAVGSTARNSFDRLNDVIDAGILPQGRGPDLHDALEFIAMVRIRHQAADLAAGREADNSIEPEALSDFERRSLRDAFQILANAQKFLKYRYQPGRAG